MTEQILQPAIGPWSSALRQVIFHGRLPARLGFASPVTFNHSIYGETCLQRPPYILLVCLLDLIQVAIGHLDELQETEYGTIMYLQSSMNSITKQTSSNRLHLKGGRYWRVSLWYHGTLLVVSFCLWMFLICRLSLYSCSYPYCMHHAHDYVCWK